MELLLELTDTKVTDCHLVWKQKLVIVFLTNECFTWVKPENPRSQIQSLKFQCPNSRMK